jgi:hypothetical protein
MKESDDGDDGSAFSNLLGAFGSHADPEKRARSERFAAMKARDKRRRPGPARTEQYNARITEAKLALAHRITVQTGLGNGDIVEQGIDLVAAKHGVPLDA